MLSSQTLVLAKYMDLLALQQRVTATNIANVDTPGYRTRRIDFLWEFQRSLERTDPEPAGPLTIPIQGGFEVKNDGNDVSLDRELRLLSEAGMRYTLAAQKVRGNIQSLRNVIKEGRGQ